MKKIFNIAFTLVLASLAIVSCKKESLEYDGPVLGHFQTSSSILYVQPENFTIDIPIGLTKASDKDVVLKVKVGEESTAEEGVQFNFESSEIVIKAGEVLGKVTVVAIFENTDEPSNLIIEIESSDNTATYSFEHNLKLQQFCPFVQEDYVGTYLFSSPVFWEDEYLIEAIADPEDPKAIIFIDPYQPDGVGYNLKLVFNDEDVNNIFITIPANQVVWYYDDGANMGDVILRDGKGTFNSCEKLITYSANHIFVPLSFNFGLDNVTLKKVD